MPVTDTEFSQSVNPQNFCTGVSLHHQALIQNSGPLIDMSDIRPGTSEFVFFFFCQIKIFLLSISQSDKTGSRQVNPGEGFKGFLVDTCAICLLMAASSLSDPVSRKSIKSAHSSRNRYSSQWTLSRPSQSQSTASARTLTSDWRTMGSHGITATESDSYSASLSQDTGESFPGQCFPVFSFITQKDQ